MPRYSIFRLTMAPTCMFPVK